jgi:hypothetical protein
MLCEVPPEQAHDSPTLPATLPLKIIPMPFAVPPDGAQSFRCPGADDAATLSCSLRSMSAHMA